MRILILSRYATVRGFQEYVEGRVLLWGLDDRDIDWELHRPAVMRHDLVEFDAVISWPFRRNARFIRDCMTHERVCHRIGIPVINSIFRADILHSKTLSIWQQVGVRCPAFQKFRGFEDLDLDYPLILRRDGVHQGRGMYLVHSAEEARHVIRVGRAAGNGRSVNLAIEFVKTPTSGGRYCKWRSHVVGDRVLPGHLMSSRNPLVNFSAARLDPSACSMDREFLQSDDNTDHAAIRRACQAIGCDIAAVDYGKLPDGSPIFWEVNRAYCTAGDQSFSWLDLRDSDIERGLAIADLIRSRVEEFRRRRRRPSAKAKRPAVELQVFGKGRL